VGGTDSREDERLGTAGEIPETRQGPAQVDADARLMLAFAAGDEASFDALFDRWSAPLLRFVERMVKDRATAEELVQDAFLRVHRARGSYEPRARFSTWLYRIAGNLARNELRRPRRARPHASTDDDTGPALELIAGGASTDDVVHSRRVGSAVEHALDALPERQRMALWLSAVEGLRYAEIAEALETTPASVKSLIHRARSALAAAVPQGEPGED
jgi:RNA polymerase sigma-70 factor (ECF subfamily)